MLKNLKEILFHISFSILLGYSMSIFLEFCQWGHQTLKTNLKYYRHNFTCGTRRTQISGFVSEAATNCMECNKIKPEKETPKI